MRRRRLDTPGRRAPGQGGATRSRWPTGAGLEIAVGRGDVQHRPGDPGALPGRSPTDEMQEPKPTVFGRVIDRIRLGRGIKIQGVDGLMVRYAQCCQPVPGDSVVGYVTQGRGISIHRSDCPNLLTLAADERRVDIDWQETAGEAFAVRLAVTGEDRRGLYADIMEAISQTGTNIRGADLHTKDGSVFGTIFVEVDNLPHLGKVMKAVRKVKGVTEIERREAPPDLNHWILKTDSEVYPFEQLEREQRAVWDGVSNPVALRHIRSMAPGDPLMIYHSGANKESWGWRGWSVSPIPIPKHPDGKLTVVDVKADGRLPQPVTLAADQIRSRLRRSRSGPAAETLGHPGAGTAVEEACCHAGWTEVAALPEEIPAVYIPTMSSPRFEVVAPFQPAGDQPKAIARADRRSPPGRQVPDPARGHRVGQDHDPGAHHRQLRQAHAGAVPQQDPGRPALRRAAAVSAPKRGRVLRLLLRLLPARGVRPSHRRVHREGRLDQPGHREPAAAGHLQPDGAGGRGHRRHGERHLRPGRPGRIPQADGHRPAGGAAGARRHPVASWCASSTAATTWPSSRAPSGSGATRSRSFPAYAEQAIRVELWGDEVERISKINPLTGETIVQLDQCAIYPAKHFVTAAAHHRASGQGDSRRAGGATQPS